MTRELFRREKINTVLLGGVAILFGGSQILPGTKHNGPVVTRAVSLLAGKSSDSSAGDSHSTGVARELAAALGAFNTTVGQLSDPQALKDAFGSYFAFKSVHPDIVNKPYLYFVDYGLPSTTPRGYVFDMASLSVLEGPFMVAHGRGSSTGKYGVPSRFSNEPGSAATSLGLYVAQETYDFHGKSGGQPYSSVGLRLLGVSTGYNDQARARGVVAHGAPYVTPSGAGRSEGCPAMEPARAQRLLPELANGGMVFLFAPDADWLHRDPWVTASIN